MENKQTNKLLIVLTLLGVSLSTYLVYYRFTTNPLMCGFGNCDIVQTSKYSVFLGVPIAVWGLLYYGTLLIALLKKMDLITKVLIIWGITYSSYLTYLELFVIKAICGWCIVSFAIILLIAFFYFKKGKSAHDISGL